MPNLPTWKRKWLQSKMKRQGRKARALRRSERSALERERERREEQAAFNRLAGTSFPGEAFGWE